MSHDVMFNGFLSETVITVNLMPNESKEKQELCVI